MAVGLNFRGKIISATHYHNTLDGFRGTVQRNGLGRFNSDVTILQDNVTPHTVQMTHGSNRAVESVAVSTTKSTPVNLHLVGPL